MPARHWINREGKRASCYEQPYAMHETVTDAGLAALAGFRREAGQDVGHWAGLRSLGRFAKDMLKEAQRREKPASLWIDYYTQVGRRSVQDLPVGLAAELDAAYRAFTLAEAEA